ncbi:DUF488 family protein [Sporosarcina sp. YIM B06819]|uniref:DUF488 family protein n=1 Tax=Sporosarcina sp. YIM B06819 TaxID=3081769 RepID=UPI003994E04E
MIHSNRILNGCLEKSTTPSPIKTFPAWKFINLSRKDNLCIVHEKQVDYLHELRTDTIKTNKIAKLRRLSNTMTVTLVFAAKDPVYNHAVILKEELGFRFK